MPSIEADKRALRVARATFQRGVGDLREALAKHRPLLIKKQALLRKLEKKVADNGGELSEEVLSCSSLMDYSSSSSSGASDHETTPVAKAKSKSEPVGKGKDQGAPAGEEQRRGGRGGKCQAGPRRRQKKTCRSKADFPDVPPGEPAPLHRGQANAQGELYAGYRKRDLRRCELRRGCPVPPKATVPLRRCLGLSSSIKANQGTLRISVSQGAIGSTSLSCSTDGLMPRPACYHCNMMQSRVLGSASHFPPSVLQIVF